MTLWRGLVAVSVAVVVVPLALGAGPLYDLALVAGLGAVLLAFVDQKLVPDARSAWEAVGEALLAVGRLALDVAAAFFLTLLLRAACQRFGW